MNREEFWTKIADNWIMPQTLEIKNGLVAGIEPIAKKVTEKIKPVKSLKEELFDDEDDDYDYQYNLQ